MPRTTKRAPLVLDDEKRTALEIIAKSRTAPFREKQRANILILYSGKTDIMQIKKKVGASRPTIYKCIDKALESGVESGLKDMYHRPKEPTITDDAKMWVVNLACTKPKDHGYAAEMWSRSLMAKHAREYGPKQGHTCLNRAAKATIQRILTQHPIRPHKMSYYLEKRDPEFDKKMDEVLVVYKEINFWNDTNSDGELPPVITISVDEKPGVQAISHTAPDIMPSPTKNSRILRDYEYKRKGTVSILAALDLHSGHVIGQVHDRHRSREFIELLMEIDETYPPEHTIRIILDNHSAHISKETRSYLATRPNRFVYVHTPTHGSWLNLVETLFGKMSRTFLKNIRVDSKDELKKRIMLGIEEINETPVIHRWKKFDFSTVY